VVVGRHGPDAHATQRVLVADRELDAAPGVGRPEPLPHKGASPVRHDQRGLWTDPPKRRDVEVVGVQMRHEYRVRRPREPRARPTHAPQVGDAVTEHRVGHQPYAGVLDPHGAVPPPGHLHLERHSVTVSGVILASFG
jgi:hypothetical protein